MTTTPADSREDVTLTTVTVDPAGHAVLLAALDPHQRVHMGQWRHVAATCDVLLDQQAGPHTAAADALTQLRCQYAAHPTLQNHPNASLGVLESGPQARVAYDLCHALGGGMESRRADRCTSTHIDVRPTTADTTP